MKRLLDLALGIVTSVGGFLEIGSIATAAQAGASFGFQLGWAIALGTLCIAFLIEMAGRFAAVSKHTIADAMRERFGAVFFSVLAMIMLVVSLLVLAAEVGGVGAALELATGWPTPVWAIPVAIIAWALLWRATFGVIENGVSVLGLVTVAFVVGAIKLHPDYGAVARGLVPTLPREDVSHYWFVAVSILGASISPYLFFFYSSGAIEEEWDVSYLSTNRVIAGTGMGFGGFLSVAVLILAALIFHPRRIEVEHYQQLPELLSAVFGRTGFWLVVASLAVACLGATLELSLALAYLVAQGFGWTWGENVRPRQDARFCLMYTLLVFAASIFSLVGVDPLKMTQISMSLTAASLPIGVLPFLILMNDKQYLGDHTNGVVGNLVVMGISLLAGVLAIVSIPLQIVGG